VISDDLAIEIGKRDARDLLVGKSKAREHGDRCRRVERLQEHELHL
jgi:hypothetical protein